MATQQVTIDVPARHSHVAEQTPETKKQPRYHVVLWNDDDHTFAYVIDMMRQLFGYTREQGQKVADRVNRQGRAVCMTTTMELAELKRDQIRAYGADPRNPRCQKSMLASIEPEEA